MLTNARLRSIIKPLLAFLISCVAWIYYFYLSHRIVV